MAHFGRSPARPRQAIIVTADFRIVLRRPHGHQIELALVLHMGLEALRRLPAIAGRPAAAVHLSKHILGFRQIVLDLDVLEHLVGEAEFLGHQIDDFEVILAFEHRLDDLLAPLQRTVRGDTRALALELRGDRQNVNAVRATGLDGERRPGGRMRVGDDQQFERLQSFERFRDARDAVAGVSLDKHRLDIVLLRDVGFRQDRRIEPSGQRDAGCFHQFLVVEARNQIIVIDFPDS